MTSGGESRNAALAVPPRRTDTRWAGPLGVFKLTQPKTKNPVTELQLFGANFRKACEPTGRRASAAARKKVVRQLWGIGKGKCRTKGRYGSAAIRGTQWLTQDRATELSSA